MEKIWLKNYPPGVPAEINPDAYQSIVEIFEQSCHLYRHNPAYYNYGVTITYEQLDYLSRDFAAYLQQKLQLKKGDRIAIMLPNTLQYPVALFGALRAGLIVVNVNPLYTSDELVFQLKNAEVETIVGINNYAQTIQQALPRVPKLKNIIITQIGDLFPVYKRWFFNFAVKYLFKKVPDYSIPNEIDFKAVMSAGRNLSLAPVEIKNQDIAFLQYTGGTTGVSKGAILTHRNLVANIQQADTWFKVVMSEEKETVITALPLYHIFSLTANCLFFTKIGGLNILITNPRDIDSLVKTMGKFKFTAITGVNTLFNALIKHPSFANLDFTNLHFTLGGGMAVQKVVAEKWQKITNSLLLEAYGLTEASPCVTINPANLKEFNGSIGLPVASTDVMIFDDNYNELPIGESGELAVKGPQVMKGYWNNPEETEKIFTKDGWLLTGDIANIDENGFIRIRERKKDMILVSGFNVYPNEIEDVIARLQGVREVAVIGIKDENSGEIPMAIIVKDDPALTTNDVIHFCRQHLTPYKIPKQVKFVDELPKSNVGKILRRALKTNETSDQSLHQVTK